MSRNKAIAAFVLAAVLLLSGCQQTAPEDQFLSEELIVPEQANYRTITPRVRNYTITSHVAIETYYPIQEELTWSDANSRYLEKVASSGNMVSEGEVLMTFEKEEQEADLAELNLQLTRKKEEVASGKTARAAEIAAAKEKLAGLSGHELRIAELNVEKLQIAYEQYLYQSNRSIDQISQQISDIQEDLADNALVAPFDGYLVSMTAVGIGDKVETGKSLARVRSQDYLLKVKTGANKLRYNMKVTIEQGSGTDIVTYTGTVISAPNIFGPEVGQNEAWIRLDEEVDPNTFKQNTQCYCVFENIKDVLVVERNAVYTEGDKYYVNILVDNTVQKRYVIPGLMNTNHMWIIDGVTEDQLLVLN